MKKLRVVAYIRVSTDEQADRGVSLDAQRARVEAYAKLADVDLVEIIEGAGESGKSLDRPGLQRALAMLGNGADALLIVTLDRLTRSLRDWGELLETHFTDKAVLLSAQEHVDVTTASGRFVLNILFAKAQFEREQIGERTATAMQHKASQGEYTGGGAPYGYRIVAGAEGEAVRVEPEPAEQMVIAEARRLRADGMSLRAVGTELAGAGMTSRTGKPFAAAQVARMVEDDGPRDA